MQLFMLTNQLFILTYSLHVIQNTKYVMVITQGGLFFLYKFLMVVNSSIIKAHVMFQCKVWFSMTIFLKFSENM